MGVSVRHSRPGNDVAVHIDELVLGGFERRDRYAIAEALSRELSRLIAREARIDGGRAQATPIAMDSIDAGEVRIAQGATPDEIASRIATSIHGALRAAFRDARPSSRDGSGGGVRASRPTVVRPTDGSTR